MADDSIKSSKASDEVKDEGHVATEWEVDVAAQLSAGFDEDISYADALRIRKKIDWHLMPLMCCEPSFFVAKRRFSDLVRNSFSAVLYL